MTGDVPGIAHPDRRAIPAAARAALAAAAFNLLAPAAMLLALRPGLPVPGTTPDERLAYIADHRALWTAGWLTWHAAAIALLSLYVALALRWRRRAPLRCGLALLCAAAGMAVDLGAQAVSIAVMPDLAPDAFAVAEAATTVLTGYLGNGLYTAAGALLVWAGTSELPRGLVALSLPVWAAGVALSAASLAQSGERQVAASAALFPLLVLWCAGMGLWLRRAS